MNKILSGWEVYEVIDAYTLKFVDSYPEHFTAEQVTALLNGKLPTDTKFSKPMVVLKTTRIATPEYFDAFHGVAV